MARRAGGGSEVGDGTISITGNNREWQLEYPRSPLDGTDACKDG